MSSEETGLSRRGLLRGAAGIGVAGVAAGLLIDTSATGTAAAATTKSPATQSPEMPDEPIVAHVKKSGDVDLFVGSRLVQFRDPELARRIARAAG
jgi:hypothetical protein